MSTIITQVLDRLDAVLLANVPAGTQVFRDRDDAQSRQETPCINVLVRDDAATPYSDDFDRHEVTVELRINVRAAVPTPVAELQHAAVHTAIVTDATLKTLCVSVRHLAASFEREEADLTSLIKSVQYRFIWLIPMTTL